MLICHSFHEHEGLTNCERHSRSFHYERNKPAEPDGKSAVCLPSSGRGKTDTVVHDG